MNTIATELDRLRAVGVSTLAYRSLRRADLRGADLRGFVLRHIDLWGADLRDARLDQADLHHVTLDSADLRGASLRRTTLRHVTARCTLLEGAAADGAIFDSCSLDGVEAAMINLRFARFVDCASVRPELRNANLRGVAFIRCRFERPRLCGAILNDSWSDLTTFSDAELDGAQGFASNRALVVSVLQSNMTGTLPQLMWVGAVSVDESRCWGEWRAQIRTAPREVTAWARRVFDCYAASGCTEALFEASSGLESAPAP